MTSTTSHLPSADPYLHLRLPDLTTEENIVLAEFKSQLQYNALYKKHNKWADDRQLQRFLMARKFDVVKSMDLIIGAMEWRDMRKVEDLCETPSGFEFLSREGATGKIYIPGEDRWGRPVLVFDSAVQNTPNEDDHMLFLAWNLEFATMLMPEDSSVEKYTVFMNLEKFSLFNMPSLAATQETIVMLTQTFPERLGHCIVFNPPFVFKAFYDSVSFLIDPHTVKKVVFLYGDMDDGGVNDNIMREIIGDNWKTLTGGKHEPNMYRFDQ